MPDSLEKQIEQIQSVIAALEAQRSLLGDAVVHTALAPLQSKITALQAQQKQAAPEERRLDCPRGKTRS
ncbi:MAG: hypothetical protein WCF84_08570 [Anaerolineae bacterium]